MQQTTKTLKKRKPEHTPVKPNKKIKSSIQELPCSQEKSKSDPPSLQSSNQELSSSQEKSSISGGNSDQSSNQQKLIPILQIVNEDFKHKPRNKNEYEHLIQMAATPYDFNLEHSQWISPQIIRYTPLNAARYVFVGKKQLQPQLQLEAKIYLQKSKKMNEKLNKFLNEADFSTTSKPIHYFRGPSGIGKSYALIQWVLENRKRDDMRILHIILDEDYLGDEFNYFAYDFIYCFYKDLNNEDFPDPPQCDHTTAQKGEKWLRFLRREKQSIDLFSEPIEDYLRKKGITFILIWDQDNIFQKNEKSPFLKSVRKNGRFNFRIISASNTNEGFQHLGKTSKVIEENVGFSKEESKEYLDNTLEKMYGKELPMENELFEKLYQITNGNGYYLSQFVYNEEVTNNYQEKFNKFTTDMKNKLRAQMNQFFHNSVKTSKNYEDFPELLLYLDCNIIFDGELNPLVDRNFTYFEDLKLKSVNPLAKEIFVNYYQEKIKKLEKNIESNFWKSLENEASRSDCHPILKGILYERYVIQKFLQNEEPYEYFLQEEEKLQKEIKGSIRYFF